MTPRILIFCFFSIIMGANYSFEVIWALAFSKHNNSSIATVRKQFSLFSLPPSIFTSSKICLRLFILRLKGGKEISSGGGFLSHQSVDRPKSRFLVKIIFFERTFSIFVFFLNCKCSGGDYYYQSHLTFLIIVWRTNHRYISHTKLLLVY